MCQVPPRLAQLLSPQASDASVLTQYLPSITISLLNLLLPWVFHMLVQAECYSPHMEVNLTLIRSALPWDCAALTWL